MTEITDEELRQIIRDCKDDREAIYYAGGGMLRLAEGLLIERYEMAKLRHDLGILLGTIAENVLPPRAPQTSTTGMNAIFGKWPVQTSDAEFLEATKDL